MSEDRHLYELMRQCATETPIGRLANVEQLAVFQWLLDGGHMTRTGKPLEQPRQHPVPIAYKPSDGSPIYAPNADFRTHETVEMSAKR